MLEAERAGAKALVVFMDDHPRNGEAWKVLRQVQNEEAHNCALIGRLLEKAGEPYSHATGEFYDKAVARRLHDHVMSVGNAVDPREGYRAFRGRDPDVYAYLADKGFPTG